MVGPEGMEKFCEDIGVEPENVSKSLFLCRSFMCRLWCISTMVIFTYSLLMTYKTQFASFDFYQLIFENIY